MNTPNIADNFSEKQALQRSVEMMMRLMPASFSALGRKLHTHCLGGNILRALGFHPTETNAGNHCPACGIPDTEGASGTGTYGLSLHDLDEYVADEKKTLKSRKHLEEGFFNLVDTLINILGTKDLYTSHHSFFVMEASIRLAKRFGISGDRLIRFKTASLLHDIGKIGIPYNIINKADSLTHDEFALIREHPVIGSRMVESFEQFGGIDRIIRHHHEKFDGTGYPSRLAGRDIPFEARLITVVDSYHAMASRRSYKDSKDQFYIIEEFRRCSRTHFDPEIAEAFVEMMQSDKDFATYKNAYVNNREKRKVESDTTA